MICYKNITNVANFFFIYETGLIVRVSCERDVNEGVEYVESEG